MRNVRIDLHSHTVFSDGELIPAELVRRAGEKGHAAIAITDHVDMTNVEFVVSNVLKAKELSSDSIKVLAGVEVTHVPVHLMNEVIDRAVSFGAEWVVVHGETLTEPVEPGTNKIAANNRRVNVLAHPGMLSLADALSAAKNDVLIEITGRAGHNITNGHVAVTARKAKAKMVVNSDTHRPENLMTETEAMKVAIGAGLTKEEANLAVRVTPAEAIRRIT
ncbi:MAG: histidinol phosphate phosphatase domain-containing protein [Candidatus Methanomethylophilaceae archaeon]|jgi:histidinol phosphatase-like PHP family hydrolase|nr:histidinol phosphate phosphatase domain-containing protein [Candidatus Methanomethylophilaceae archaeon]